MKSIWFILYVVLCLNGSAQGKEMILGHNLTPTTAVLGAGESMVGSYALGKGITNNLTIATSPWLDVSYNMPNIGLKYLVPGTNDHTSLTFEGIYFKTLQYGKNLYEQESIFLRPTIGAELYDVWNSYISFGYQYFYIDRKTFSLRAVPENADPRTLSISTLQVFSLFDSFAVLLEFGVLGLNYPIPYIHSGASVNLRAKNFMLQIGISKSRSKGVNYTSYEDNQLRGFFVGEQVIYHPELQI